MRSGMLCRVDWYLSMFQDKLSASYDGPRRLGCLTLEGGDNMLPRNVANYQSAPS